jgi:hypothetical protein
MDGERKLRDMQAKSRKLRVELEVLSAQIHAQLAENQAERDRRAMIDQDDEEEAV